MKDACNSHTVVQVAIGKRNRRSSSLPVISRGRFYVRMCIFHLFGPPCLPNGRLLYRISTLPATRQNPQTSADLRPTVCRGYVRGIADSICPQERSSTPTISPSYATRTSLPNG